MAAETSPPPSLKRKRKDPEASEIEVDISLPEPLSKKALRRAKKGKPAISDAAPLSDHESNDEDEKKATVEKKNVRSDYGIWIGNLPWSVTKQDLRDFITKNSSIPDSEISRVHMPAPSAKAGDTSFKKPKNKGFAYIDFNTEGQLTTAMALSESLILGRRVLIKNAKSFEGRPEKPKTTTPINSEKPPSKRIFVGNLGFDVTKDDLIQHFSQCGTVEDVHMATFEDSGKCKGFAWITFAEIEEATSAVVGYILKDNEDEDDDTEGKKKKQRKWWVNKIHGRVIRAEFAEDKAVRYQKRFSKPRNGNQQDGEVAGDGDGDGAGAGAEIEVSNGVPEARFEKRDQNTAHDRRREKRSKGKEKEKEKERWKPKVVHPSMEARPARGTGAIVESQAKRISFD